MHLLLITDFKQLQQYAAKSCKQLPGCAGWSRDCSKLSYISGEIFAVMFNQSFEDSFQTQLKQLVTLIYQNNFNLTTNPS